MNITISPIKNKNRTFRTAQKDESTSVAKEKKKPLTHQQLSEKRTKIALGCCLAAFLTADIIYFATKRNIKYGKIQKQAIKAKKMEEMAANAPKPILEDIVINKDKYGENALEKFTELVNPKKYI